MLFASNTALAQECNTSEDAIGDNACYINSTVEDGVIKRDPKLLLEHLRQAATRSIYNNDEGYIAEVLSQLELNEFKEAQGKANYMLFNLYAYQGKVFYNKEKALFHLKLASELGHTESLEIYSEFQELFPDLLSNLSPPQ